MSDTADNQSTSIAPEAETVMSSNDAPATDADKTMDSDETRELIRRLGFERYGGDHDYRDFTLVGEGGLGLVQRAYEPNLGRQVAIKVLRPQFRSSDQYVERLIREARATAQIEHPNIVPVYCLAATDELGVFFAMRYLQGDTLRHVLEQLKAKDPEYEAKYSRMRLLSIFNKVCQGVAYAHSKGVVHRDLKPENILIGDYGEVIVLDWGLVRQLDSNASPEAESKGAEVDIHPEGEDITRLTLDGAVSGTPKYMSPEQARGHNSAVDAQSDVYSLGVILYEILTLTPAFPESDTRRLLQDVAGGIFKPPRRVAPRRTVPRELNAVCLTAMSREKADRYASVQQIIDDIYAYLDQRPVSVYRDPLPLRWWKIGLRHPVISSIALAAIVALALALSTVGLVQRAHYRTLLDRGRSSIATGRAEFASALQAWLQLDARQRDRITKKRPDSERRLEFEARRRQSLAESHFELATVLLSGVPARYRTSPAVRHALRDIYHTRVHFALKTRQYGDLGKWLRLLRVTLGDDYGKASDEMRLGLQEAERILRGESRVALRTVPAPASVQLWRQVADPDRGTIVRSEAVALGQTPLDGLALRRGNYLLEAEAPGYPRVVYPLLLRQGGEHALRIYLPASIPEGMAYVPAGPFIHGGDAAPHYREHERTLPGFFISRHEVTVAEYLEFWRSLTVERDRLAYLSRIQFAHADHCPVPAWDMDGVPIDGVQMDRPVVGIDIGAAEAYCEWLSEQRGMTCMLPTAEQWEKAARGADGRHFPWGNEFRATYAFTLENETARERYGLWAPPGSMPQDVSIYGVYDMGGNVREWTRSKFPGISPFHQIKGASSSTTERFAYAEFAGECQVVPSDVGFRYVIPVVESAD